AFERLPEIRLRKQPVDPELHGTAGAASSAAKQAGACKSGSASGWAIAQYDLVPPCSSSTAHSPIAHLADGRPAAGMAASKIAKLLPRRSVHSGSRGKARSRIPSR